MNLAGFMVAMGLSTGVLLMSISLLQTARDNFFHHHQLVMFEEGAEFVVDIIERTLQQATPESTGPESSPRHRSAGSATSHPHDSSQTSQTSHTSRTSQRSSSITPARPWPPQLDDGSIQGVDNAYLGGDADSVGKMITPGLGGSDMLWVHLGSASGTQINCAGFERSGAPLDASDSAWVIIHLVPGPAGEPELHCRYRGKTKWESQAILSGVEYFQVLFGLDTDQDGLPNQYLNAAAISARQREAPADVRSLWHQVVAVHVALVMRSTDNVKFRTPKFQPMDLFGRDYATTLGTADPGTRVGHEVPSDTERHRVRYRIDTIIFLQQRKYTA